MRTSPHLSILALCAALQPLAAQQSGLPTTQPGLVTIVRETVKNGRAAEHARFESGWPAAYERAKSPTYYLAMASITGPAEVWYVVPQQSHAAMEADMKREDADTVLARELQRLRKGDAEFVESIRTIQARARPDLSRGAFPDVAKERYWEITVFRVRPGHEAAFDSVAKLYGAAAERAAPGVSWRVYQVMAGMPSPTYLVFSSVKSLSEFDDMMSADDKIMRAMSSSDVATLGKLWTDALISSETNRYRLDPGQSYVSRETRMADAEFWMPKRQSTAKPRIQKPQQP